jgi:hypothetical protein
LLACWRKITNNFKGVFVPYLRRQVCARYYLSIEENGLRTDTDYEFIFNLSLLIVLFEGGGFAGGSRFFLLWHPK